MGVGGISIWQLLIILAIVIMIFGTKKLKSLGTDLGSAVKGFRASVTDKSEDKDAEGAADTTVESTVQQNESAETQQTEQRKSKCSILVRQSFCLSQSLASLLLVQSVYLALPAHLGYGLNGFVDKFNPFKGILIASWSLRILKRQLEERGGGLKMEDIAGEDPLGLSQANNQASREE